VQSNNQNATRDVQILRIVSIHLGGNDGCCSKICGRWQGYICEGDQMTAKDPLWLSHVARVEVIIDRYGICNALGAFAEALENIEIDLCEECKEFEGSQQHKNIEYQKKVIEAAMSAVDLDPIYGNAEARKVSKERFKSEIESIELPEFLKEQAE